MEVIAYILAAIAFSLVLMYIGIVRAERYYYKNECDKLQSYMRKHGYPIGYSINGYKVVVDIRMNCKKCAFQSITDGKENCIKRPEYGPCYSSARSDKQSIKFYEEEGNQA